MARPREGWKLRKPRREGDSYTVRFTLETGKSREVSTGTRDPTEAAAEAARIYAAELTAGSLAVRGRIDPTLQFDKLLALWLADLEKTHDVTTVGTYTGYGRRFLTFFGNSLADITRPRMGDYQRDRLTVVLRDSVQKERSALNTFLEWCLEQGVLAEEHIPKWPRIPDRATGVRSGRQRAKPIDVTVEQVRTFIMELPLLSLRHRHGRRFPIRARFVFMAETGLRPATIDGLSTPEHWHPGARELVIPPELDKARYGRPVPLTDRATAALEAAVMLNGGKPGTIFGRHDYRTAWERARVAAGLPKGFAPYDLRHHFAGFMADAAEARAVMHLAGHLRLTTTDRYVRGAADLARTAVSALGSGGILGEGDISMSSAKEGSRTPTRVTPLEPERRSIPQVSDTYGSVRGPDTPPTPPEGPGSGGSPETLIRAATHLAMLRAEWEVFDRLAMAELLEVES